MPFESRRRLLQRCSLGFGSLALASILSDEAGANALSTASPLSPRSPHFPARAKRVVFLFMKGGPSHIDTFDYKPQLELDHGKELPFAKPRVQFAKTSTLLKSPWKFSPHGESGIPVSELFPQVGQHVDDLCILNSVHGTNPAHGGALLKLHTGSDRFVRPSMGSWITYGLGTENVNLPAFITICPTLAHGGVKNWGGAFLPAYFEGTPLGNASMPAAEARLDHLGNPKFSARGQRAQLDLLRQMNESHLQETGDNDSLEARIASFELAFGCRQRCPN